MSEIWQPTPEELASSKSIRRLGADLTYASENYIDALGALQTYTRDEHQVSDQAANNFIYQLVQQHELPTANEFECSPSLSINRLRYAVYTTLIPLYESSHQPAEIANWLPYAYRSAIGAHTRNDACTAHQRCPAALIALNTRNQMLYPHFHDTDYQVDPTKKAQLIDLHCEAAIQNKLLTEADAGAMQVMYYNKFSARFGKKTA